MSSSDQGDGLAGGVDHVADRELAAAAGLDLAVDADVARLEQPAGCAAGLDEVHQLEQLAEPDTALPHLDVHGGHATTRRGQRRPPPRTTGAFGVSEIRRGGPTPPAGRAGPG